MKFCAQCGERLDDASVFCSRCGAKQAGFEEKANAAPDNANEAAEAVTGEAESAFSEAEAEYREEETAVAPVYSEAVYDEPKPIKKRKRGWIVAAVIAAALLISTAALAATGAYKSLIPHSKLKLGLAERSLWNGSVNEITRALPAQDGVNADLEMGVSIDPGEIGGFYGLYYGQIFDMINSIKLYTSIDSRDCLDLSVRADYKGNTAADARLFINRDDMGLYIAPAQDEYYTMSRNALIEKFAPGMDPAVTDFLFEKFDREAANRDFDKLRAIVGKTLKEADVKIDRNVNVDLFYDGVEEKGALYTITPNEEQIKAMLNEIADLLDSEDCYLASYLDDVLRLLNELQEHSDLDLDLGELSTMKDIVDEMREDIPDMAKEFVEDGYKFEVVMQGNEIVRQRLCNETDRWGYDVLKDGGKTRAMAYEYYLVPDGDMDVTCDVTCEKNGSVTEFDMAVGEWSSVTRIKGSIDESKRSAIGTYAGSFDVTGETEDGETYPICRIEVAEQDGGMMHRIMLDSETAEEIASLSMESAELDILVKDGDGVEKPAGAKEVDLNDYTKDELARLFSGIGMKLLGGLEGIFG